MIILCLCSCDSYNPPNVDTPKQWSNTKLRQKQLHRLAKIHWWKRYHSAELNQYIDATLHTNHEIQLAINHIEKAQAELKTIKLSWLPGFPLVGGFTQLPLYGNPGTLLITAPDYILNILELYQKQKSAEQHLNASRHLYHATRLMMIHQVINAYFSLLSQQEALALNNRLLHHHQLKLKLWQNNFQSGLISSDPIWETQSKLRLIKAKIKVIVHNIYASQNILHYLMNENPGSIRTQISFSKIPVQTEIPLDFPLHVIQNRPDVQQAEAELRASHHRVDATIAKLFPQMNLGGFFGEGRYIQGPINAPNATAILNTLDPPTYGKIDVSRTQYRRQLILYVHLIRKALKDIDTDLHAYQAYLQQYQHINEAFNQAQAQCHNTKIRFENGIVSSFEYINCQIQLDELALLRNQKKLMQILTINRIFEDLGVGYEP